MAMINCPECGSRISDKASVCPTCGCPSEEFKKIDPAEQKAQIIHQEEEDGEKALIKILAIVLCIGLFACLLKACHEDVITIVVSKFS